VDDAPRAEQSGSSERAAFVACGDHDDRWRSGQGRQLCQQSEPSTSRHDEVGEDEVDRFRSQEVQRLLGRLGASDTVAGVGGDAGDQLPDCRVVVHDEHAVLHGCSFRPLPASRARAVPVRLAPESQPNVNCE
jgi:hypothetical protein